ncbi:MAG: hypothetical protein ACTSX4_06900 [Candidatus Helarchaeota archaeon]
MRKKKMLGDTIPSWELLLIIDERGFTLYRYHYDQKSEKISWEGYS